MVLLLNPDGCIFFGACARGLCAPPARRQLLLRLRLRPPPPRLQRALLGGAARRIARSSGRGRRRGFERACRARPRELSGRGLGRGRGRGRAAGAGAQGPRAPDPRVTGPPRKGLQGSGPPLDRAEEPRVPVRRKAGAERSGRGGHRAGCRAATCEGPAPRAARPPRAPRPRTATAPPRHSHARRLRMHAAAVRAGGAREAGRGVAGRGGASMRRGVLLSARCRASSSSRSWSSLPPAQRVPGTRAGACGGVRGARGSPAARTRWL